MNSIAFVTDKKTIGMTESDRLAARALQRLGCEVVSKSWDDPAARWNEFSAVVLRSCWDYHERIEEFRAWLDRLKREEVRVINPLEVVIANLEKSYLLGLAKAGLPVVPTEWIPKGSRISLVETMRRLGWAEAVLKPAISAGARDTWHLRMAEAGPWEDRLRELLQRGDAMLQPFIPEIVSRGEWSFVFFGGGFSHAVIKKPHGSDFRVQESHGGSTTYLAPESSLLKKATELYRSLDLRAVYARLDLVERENPQVLIMEIELIEPAFYLEYYPPGAEKFALSVLNFSRRP